MECGEKQLLDNDIISLRAACHPPDSVPPHVIGHAGLAGSVWASSSMVVGLPGPWWTEAHHLPKAANVEDLQLCPLCAS